MTAALESGATVAVSELELWRYSAIQLGHSEGVTFSDEKRKAAAHSTAIQPGWRNGDSGVDGRRVEAVGTGIGTGGWG